MKQYHLLAIFLFPFYLLAQPVPLPVPFEDANNAAYAYPLTGGLTNPQFSNIDLDGDGVQDLVYFDRQGFVVVPFLNGGTANAINYTYAPEYAARFPYLENWMLLRDYNCDGINDIFAYKRDYNTGEVSITVYKGGRDAQNKIIFSLAKNIIRYRDKTSPQLYNLFNSAADLPAIDDLDGDGDMDILNFNTLGGHVSYFENQSQEQGFGCDSLLYVFADNCWGRFYESGASALIDLSPRIDSCPFFPNWVPLKSAGPRHSGSTLLTLDMDNDGDKELILGDLSFSNLTLLTNGGNRDTAHMTHQEVYFPQNSVVANIDIFPAAFHVDVNNDGVKDLLAAPNILNNASDTKNWYYQNTGTNANPTFTYQSNDFLVREMIDVGTNSAPTLVDYNGDGLLDIVVGNFHRFVSASVQESFLTLYENIGTATQPAYRLASSDIANLKQYNQLRLVPTFGDLDGDNDLDLIVGLETGELLYLTNTGTATNPIYTALVANFGGIDVGNNSTPQLVDADRDGDLDLIIGERNGNINYYENTGSATNPIFSSTATSETFGFIDAKLPGYIYGNSMPHLLDVDGVYHFFVGNEVGQLWHYTNIDGNLLGTFTKENNSLDQLDVGKESIVAIRDLNGDNKLDIVLGNKRGGLNIYSQDVVAVSSTQLLKTTTNQLTISPNPTTGQLTIVFSKPINEEVSIQITNLLGQTVFIQQEWLDKKLNLTLNNIPSGTYFIRIDTPSEHYVEKVIKQ